MANETNILSTIETGTKVYDTSVTIKNKSLQSQTKAIIRLMQQMKSNMFEIAMRLKMIDDADMYKADGFDSVQDYAEQVFGYKHAMTYNLLRVAGNYLIQDGKTYSSILAHDNNDYTVSQLQEVLVIEPETAMKLDANDVINPDMTTKQIRSQVKKFRNGEISDTGEIIDVEPVEDEAGEESETADSVEANKPDANFYDDVCSTLLDFLTYEIPANVAESAQVIIDFIQGQNS